MKTKVKIVLVNDCEVVVAGVRSCLASNPQFEVIGVASSSVQALALCGNPSLDVVLVFEHVSDASGVSVMKLIHEKYPTLKIVAHLSSLQNGILLQVIRCGVFGCIFLKSTAKELISALKSVAEGKRAFPPGEAEKHFEELFAREGKLGSGDTQLSKRELDVVRLVPAGNKNEYIGGQLHISVRTVEKHRQRAMKKLGVHNAAELTRVLIERGLVVL